MQMSIEWEEGFAAFRQGVRCHGNPYMPTAIKKYQDWQDGWFYAELKERKP